jgi:hypothetical protein
MYVLTVDFRLLIAKKFVTKGIDARKHATY